LSEDLYSPLVGSLLQTLYCPILENTMSPASSVV